jgi:hypothetical protein
MKFKLFQIKLDITNSILEIFGKEIHSSPFGISDFFLCPKSQQPSSRRLFW